MSNSTCSIEGCGSAVLARGWCGTHYRRWHRGRDPLERKRGEVREGRKICPRCQEDVLLEDWYSKTSSWCRECERTTKRDAYVPVNIPLPAVYCVECGTKYRPSRRTDITCSELCGKQRRIRFNRISAPVNRAMRRAAYVEQVSPALVFERDAYICQICHEDIDRAAEWPNPRSASMDHILPLSRGGDHSYINCQASHLGCNASKRDRVMP